MSKDFQARLHEKSSTRKSMSEALLRTQLHEQGLQGAAPRKEFNTQVHEQMFKHSSMRGVQRAQRLP